MIILLILAFLVALLAVIFAITNSQPVTINLLFGEIDGSLAIVLLITLAIGTLIGLLASSPGLVRRSWTITNQRKKISSLEKDIQGQKTELDQIKKTQSEEKNKESSG
jgi:uncharacterized integral membrane protein